MRIPPIALTQTDAFLALDAALTDAWLTPGRRQELIRKVIELSLVSPDAFQRLCHYGRKPQLVGELTRLAYEASHRHLGGPAFRAWIDRQPEFQAAPKPPLLLSRSQQVAWAALEETAQLYFSGALRHARIQPRTSRLIAGPSGIGKTHLARKFAEEHGWGFLLLTFGEWIPHGSRTGDSTAVRVMKFLAAHERCVLAIDELDKISAEFRHEWSISVMNDLYALLDRSWYKGGAEGGKTDLHRKLRETTFIVGCGTWQSLWSVEGGAQRSIGFQKSAGGAAPMADQIRAARVIPTELLNRFHPELLLLEPMQAADFASLCQAEGLEAQAAEIGQPLDYTQAEASGLGMRWIEGQVLRLHLARTKHHATNLPVTLKPSLPTPELS
jgi:hypothetical protein